MGNDQKIIEHYELKPHPEGGWFKDLQFARKNKTCSRREDLWKFNTILFEQGEKSRLHFLDSDEVWYFHFGSPVSLHLFTKGVIGQCYWETPLITKKSFNIQSRGVQYLVQNWRMIMVH